MSGTLLPVEAKIFRFLSLIYPATLNIHFVRHRLNLATEPPQETHSLIARSLIERLPKSDPRGRRATRQGIALEVTHRAEVAGRVKHIQV